MSNKRTGIAKVDLINVRVAGTPIFMPGTNPKNNHTMCNVICNRGRNPRTNEEMTDEFTLNFWDKYATTAAWYLYKGLEISAVGELRSYKHPTGRTRPDGRPEIERRVEVRVNEFFFGKEPMKVISARGNQVIAERKASGRLLGDLTVEEVIKVDPKPMEDYNPTLAAQTGMYGNARIWTKEQGMLKGNTLPATPATPAAAPANAATNINELTTQIKALQAQMAGANTGQSKPVDPFAGVFQLKQ